MVCYAKLAALEMVCSLAFAACAQGKRVRFWTVTELVRHLLERREERDLQRLLTQLERHDLLILDELATSRLPRSAPSCCLESSAGLTSG